MIGLVVDSQFHPQANYVSGVIVAEEISSVRESVDGEVGFRFGTLIVRWG